MHHSLLEDVISSLNLFMRLSGNTLFPKLCVMLKKLSSEASELARLRYQIYACGNFLSKP
ncbi:MAG: hypothetical protein B1H11_09585 [Desulfobacteraceae bacterium 4484_190.1]|nr:MAG: hypothetical protein B1H11_09585 [Desulfobacteraceae bacterium 4484_190.1]